jgi:hypothetical protein
MFGRGNHRGQSSWAMDDSYEAKHADHDGKCGLRNTCSCYPGCHGEHGKVAGQPQHCYDHDAGCHFGC